MAGRYPEIEPYEHGMLDVGDGNQIYWEQCGNPAGKPAVVLHGGPGSGCSAGTRQFFDPSAYRIVLFDQRNCGRSTPHASDPATDLSANTTDHLLADMELLRSALGIDQWLLFGGSWGSLLGLVYALRHPSRVSEMVLLGLATSRGAEVDLLINGLGKVFPEAYEKFRTGVPEHARDGSLAAAYLPLLSHPDFEVRDKAARDWCDWEDAIIPTAPPSLRYKDPDYRICFARLVTHYWSQGSFVEDRYVLDNVPKLAGIPGVLVQGAMDMTNLLGGPWLLHHAWPGSELVITDAGHDTHSPDMVSALIAATDRFRCQR
ncbi:prolyl aminopeptidase [Kibdelosporangium phytohabitans]|uniref:Proline iminopeptidase n=1 Tax=Kibdelosporangium phytohabitans TaxID=860235 RepID=A0A0N9HRD5_9PSEU|nr:prolyl aminopeptidase [Kibdelosporangium phytohabitans]ALG07393.1 proline iminopeptidase [Kibdelosporangium phytohabitans]MBE1471724.1 proline iminopeptidase [Kibdelosporangium phytohabitans]